jgi:hypothetical protein
VGGLVHNSMARLRPHALRSAARSSGVSGSESGGGPSRMLDLRQQQKQREQRDHKELHKPRAQWSRVEHNCGTRAAALQQLLLQLLEPQSLGSVFHIPLSCFIVLCWSTIITVSVMN